MSSIKQLKETLHGASCDQRLAHIYCCGPDEVQSQKERADAVIDVFSALFGVVDDSREIALFSAPGRTEVGGNHTDHQHGCVLAASVNLDILACAGVQSGGVFQSSCVSYA